MTQIYLICSFPLLLHSAESYWLLKSLSGALGLYTWKYIGYPIRVYLVFKHIIDSRIKYGLILYVIHFRVIYSCSLSLWQILDNLITSSGVVEPHPNSLSHQIDWDYEICYFRFLSPNIKGGRIKKKQV